MQVLITAILSAAAAILGVILGHSLTRSRERENWLRDRRKEKWRELLTTLTETTLALSRLYHVRKHSPELYNEADWTEADHAAAVTMLDRLYIYKEMRDFDLEKIWFDATRNLSTQNRHAEFIDASNTVRDLIIQAAIKDA